MADAKLSALPAASALGASDLVYGDQSATSVKITTAQVKTFASASPTLVTPALGVATATSVAVGGGSIGTDSLEVTGTTTHNGNFTLSSSSLILSGNISAAAWTTSGIRHQGVAFSATDTSSSGTVAAAYTNVFGVGTILASSSTTYTNYFNTYFKDPVASTNVTMTNKWSLGADSLQVGTSNPFTISTAGAVAGKSLALNGAAIGSNAISAIGNILATSASGGQARIFAGLTADTATRFTAGIDSSDVPFVSFSNGTTRDTFLYRLGAANFRMGSTSSATPVAYKLTIGEASRGGTDSNVSGANGTIQSGLGTGTSAPSTLIFQVPVTAGGTTTAQVYTTMLTVGPSVVLGNAAIATNATDGFLYIPTCAGTPTGVPTTQTGRVAMIYDTTNHQFWIFDGSWLQPKTPAAAAVVNWQ